jgi:hypothetical protein
MIAVDDDLPVRFIYTEIRVELDCFVQRIAAGWCNRMNVEHKFHNDNTLNQLTSIEQKCGVGTSNSGVRNLLGV